MDQVKKNAFWVALGALAAVAGGLYFVLVAFGIEKEIAARKSKLEKAVKDLKSFAGIDPAKAADPEKGLPVPVVVEYWTQRRELLEKEAQRIEDLYRSKDRSFEQIFGASRGGQVGLATFVSQLRDAIEKELEKPYAALFEEPFEKVCPIAQPIPQREEEIPFAQKKYYIARAILQAAASKEVAAKAVSSIAIKDPSTVKEEKEKEQKKGAAPEKDLDRIEVAAVLKMRAEGVPALVSQLLRAEVLFEVREVSITAIPFGYPELEPWKVFEAQGAPAGAPSAAGPWLSFPRDVFIGVIDSADPKARTRPDDVKEPPVQVRVVADALDFNIPEKTR